MKFRKKPVVIEAWQVGAETPHWIEAAIGNDDIRKASDGRLMVYMENLLEGVWLDAMDGDWITRTNNGELDVITNKIFEATHERVE